MSMSFVVQLVGLKNSGKTSIIEKYCNKQKDVNSDFSFKEIIINDLVIKLGIYHYFDHKYQHLIFPHGIFLVVDITSQESLNYAKYYLNFVKKYCAKYN